MIAMRYLIPEFQSAGIKRRGSCYLMWKWQVMLVAILFLSTGASLIADSPIPKALQPGRYEVLWTNSPFTRPLNAAESYVITGIARIGGKPLITLLNTTSGERFTLSTEKNAQGWRLIELRPDPNPKNITARINVCDEEVTVRFDEQQLSDKALLKAAQGVSGPANAGNKNSTREAETERFFSELRERFLQGAKPGARRDNPTRDESNPNRSPRNRGQQRQQQ